MNYIWNNSDVCNNIIELKEIFAKHYNKDVNSLMDLNMKLRNPLILPNIEKASEKIKEYINNGKKIFVFGDYDVDGITSTASLVLGLRHIGAQVEWRVPKRDEGYGLNLDIVDYAIDNGFGLIITVDTGIMGHVPIQYANENGVEVIVTDHHQLLRDELPTDITVDPWINPDYPFKNICGCMVVYKLLRILIPDIVKTPLHSYLVALATIATITDIMPLQDENFVFVKSGLPYIKNNYSYGLKELLERLNLRDKEIKASDIAFTIGPALNAAGRFDDASICVKLLLADDDALPVKLVDKILSFNDKRKELQHSVLDNLDIDKNDKFIIKKLNIQAGLAGIIATKVSNTYQKPCIIFCDNKDILTGSGRSPAYFDISSIIDNKEISGGGHKSACGISIQSEKFDWFVKYANDFIKDVEIKYPELDITADITEMFNNSIINNEFVDFVHYFEPYGEGHCEPIFLIKNVNVIEYNVIGQLQNTVKFNLSDNSRSTSITGIAFGDVKDKYLELGCPEKMDIVCQIGYNEWRGQKTIQLMIIDMQSN